MAKDIDSKNIQSDNIFEDFDSDLSLWEEVKSHEETEKRDVYFYLKMGGTFLKIFNACFFVIIAFLFLYWFLQSQESPTRYSIFTPVCSLFLWDAAGDLDTCHSVSYYLQSQSNILEEEKIQQAQEVGNLIGDIYLVDNFIYSEVVSFLVNLSQNNLEPTEILTAFDTLKNKYEPIDKSKISCNTIVVNKPGVLEARCEAFSSDWDNEILEIQEGILGGSNAWGTSISVASSFIDFIENEPNRTFSVLDKQKVFFASNVTWRWIYTKKTPFVLRLWYNGNNIINF